MHSVGQRTECLAAARLWVCVCLQKRLLTLQCDNLAQQCQSTGASLKGPSTAQHNSSWRLFCTRHSTHGTRSDVDRWRPRASPALPEDHRARVSNGGVWQQVEGDTTTHLLYYLAVECWAILWHRPACATLTPAPVTT